MPEVFFVLQPHPNPPQKGGLKKCPFGGGGNGRYLIKIEAPTKPPPQGEA